MKISKSSYSNIVNELELHASANFLFKDNNFTSEFKQSITKSKANKVAKGINFMLNLGDENG